MAQGLDQFDKRDDDKFRFRLIFGNKLIARYNDVDALNMKADDIQLVFGVDPLIQVRRNGQWCDR